MTNSPTNDEPPSFTHYTTVSGFMGIVDTCSIWASNVSFLNDRRELIHGLEGAEEALKRLSKKKAFEKWQGLLSEVIDDYKNGGLPDIYAACFCANPDLLSQWRGYAALAQGVSISFRRNEFKSAFGAHGLLLSKVMYTDRSTSSKMHIGLIRALGDLEAFEDLLDEGTEARVAQVRLAVNKLLPRFKHLGFKGEQEWRLTVAADQNKREVRYRVGPGYIVPYIELKGLHKKLPISTVTVGPGPHQDLALKSIQMYLSSKGYKEVELLKSTVPYRF